MFHLQLFVSLAILLLLFPTQSTTFAIFKGPCPTNITSIGKFDMKKYVGMWYTYSSYPSDYKSRCKSSEFIENNSAYSVIRNEISPFTHTRKMRKFNITDLDTDVGKFVMSTDHKAMPFGLEMYVLDTDYDNFAIQYACIDIDSVFNVQTAVINTRERNPLSKIIYTAQKIAQLSGIKIDLMIKVNQHFCPPALCK